MNKNISFDGVNQICASGDLHGIWHTLAHEIVNKYDMENNLIFCAGDIGLGFRCLDCELDDLKSLNNEISKKNNHVIFIRGNHDCPEIFENEKKYKKYRKFSHIHIVPDYTVVEVNKGQHHVLCIGGSISIDRKKRTLGKNYWSGEGVVFDNDKLNEVCMQYFGLIDIMITHNKPFKQCYPYTKNGLRGWSYIDDTIDGDVDKCDDIMEDIITYLSKNAINPTTFIYGHYHDYYAEIIEIMNHNTNTPYKATFKLLKPNVIYQI